MNQRLKAKDSQKMSHQCTSLVTGGAGFIGSHVAESLIQMGHQVVVLDDLSGGFADNIPGGAEFVQGSILDHELLEKLFRPTSSPTYTTWRLMRRRG